MTGTKLILGLMLWGLGSCGGKDVVATGSSNDERLARQSFVLVHGAWMGAWAWNAVAGALRAGGANVIAVELPGHGEDRTPVAASTFDAYVARLDAAIDAAPGKVIVVGHSMAGLVISRAGEERAGKIAKLVYLAAYVPADGDSLQALAGTDAASHVGPVLEVDPSTGLAAIPTDQLRDVFCADCSPAQLALLTTRYRDEPLPAFGAPAHVTTQNWGRVAKYYIYTTQDHAVSHDLQIRMTAPVTWAATGLDPFSWIPNYAVISCCMNWCSRSMGLR